MLQNLGLAVRALAEVRRSGKGVGERQGCRLVLAGGFDARLRDNLECFAETIDLVASLNLQDQVCSRKLEILPSSCLRDNFFRLFQTCELVVSLNAEGPVAQLPG